MSIRIIPLGGLGEVGKNMTVFESGEDAIVVDAGLAFPRDEHLGVDLVLPEMTYLAERRNGVRALLLTHGHEDHVGALPYLLRVAQVREIWATRLTLGLIKSKLDEHGLLRAAELREAEIGKPVELGRFRVEFVRMAHSIPDSAALAIQAEGKLIVHTGDYKLDHTPIDGQNTDVGRLAELGNQGVDLHARRLHERRAAGRDAVRAGRGRGVPADLPAAHGTHPRLVVRVERPPRAAGDRRRRRPRPQGGGRRPLDAQEREHRAEPRLHGRSRRHPAQAGGPAGAAARRAADHLHGQPGRADVGAHADRLQRPSGSQRRARRHRDHLGQAGAGNELRVHDAINRLAQSGAEVLHQEIAPVHVSGHGNAEELRTILALLRPKAVMPVHGEFRMLAAHAQLARDAGVPASAIVLAENGTVVELSDTGPRIVDQVQAGVTFVDGLGVGDVKDVALRDRRRLSEDGVLIIVATLAPEDGGAVARPELIARGFAGADELIEETRDEAERVLGDLLAQDMSEIKLLQEHLHDSVGQLIYDRTRRRPMILPVIVEV